MAKNFLKNAAFSGFCVGSCLIALGIYLLAFEGLFIRHGVVLSAGALMFLVSFGIADYYHKRDVHLGGYGVIIGVILFVVLLLAFGILISSWLSAGILMAAVLYVAVSFCFSKPSSISQS